MGNKVSCEVQISQANCAHVFKYSCGELKTLASKLAFYKYIPNRLYRPAMNALFGIWSLVIGILSSGRRLKNLYFHL